MKKLILLLTIALLSIGSAFALPQFKGLDNNHGKTTIKIEIPSFDRDSSNGLSIDNVRLYNKGKILNPKKVDAIWGDNSTIILEFKKLKEFEDCTLSFTLNGESVSMDIQSFLMGKEKIRSLLYLDRPLNP